MVDMSTIIEKFIRDSFVSLKDDIKEFKKSIETELKELSNLFHGLNCKTNTLKIEQLEDDFQRELLQRSREEDKKIKQAQWRIGILVSIPSIILAVLAYLKK